ncbi:hypothetical protein P3G55_02170 [Leptospira sp. 96542]|nr:hypothetical protein [Leptospira sp. 96542]
MKKISALCIFVTFVWMQEGLSAKCFGFSKNKDITVCIDGNSNAVRKQASEICKTKSGKDCGNITGYSGSCSAGKNLCLDHSGNEKKSLKVD